MTNKELDNYMKTVYPNFDSHIEKGTIEMSNEYYNLLEEKMARLINENKELKEKYENAVADYENVMFEKEQLKKQLEEYQLQNINLRADIMIQKMAFPNELIKDKTFYNLYDMPTYEELLVQQKEFIKYLEDGIKSSSALDTINKQTAMYIYSTTLRKYKEIIGVSDEKK